MKKRAAMHFTCTVIAIWAAVWLAVTFMGISPVLCGKGMAKIGNGYYRIFTAGLTHERFLHLLANASAMFWIGGLYERHMGSGKFAVIGTICAVAAQFLFLCVYREADHSIGGSVYTFAFLGFGLAAQFLVPGFPKIRLGTWSGNWLAVYGAVSNIPRLAEADMSAIVIHAIALALGVVTGAAYWLFRFRDGCHAGSDEKDRWAGKTK